MHIPMCAQTVGYSKQEWKDSHFDAFLCFVRGVLDSTSRTSADLSIVLIARKWSKSETLIPRPNSLTLVYLAVEFCTDPIDLHVRLWKHLMHHSNEDLKRAKMYMSLQGIFIKWHTGL